MSLHTAIAEYKSQEDDLMLSESSTDLILEDDDEDLVEVVDDQLQVLINGQVTAI